ncbi:Arginine decarboxylase [Leptosomus discolor]|uniref:Arginine decarboxylase n=1 Tax=Leptosomus discolor TaxID=188344 RepID=A0A091PKV3_LEPDC|nr:Arginine decarboxylase [Leptosomus discolor]
MNGYLNESNFMMVEEGFTTRDLLENLLVELCQEGDQQAFFVADLGDIVKKHLRFLKALPRVKPYFPVKCNGSEGVIRLLAELGAGFACTNKAEIAQVRSIGVPADKIFYSSPCKQVAHIKYAASHGVRLMTFDNEVELSKVARSHPHARMLLGVAADSSPSAHPSMTFGTTLKSCRHLLETAKEQAVEVVGISFHLGSRSLEPQAFAQSVAAAQLAFEMGTELGYQMHLLDIGGGFPGTEDTRARFEEMAAVINSALDLYFPDGCGVEIVATPGRYYVTSAFTFAASITAREEVPADQPGSDARRASCITSAMASTAPSAASCLTAPAPDLSCTSSSISPLQRPCPEPPSHGSSLRGPPGHTEDRIADSLELPELHVGDWLIFEDMGAYTITTPSPLEGCPQPQITYAMSRVAWKAIQLCQGKLPPTEDDRESVCTPLSCGWEMAETLCVPPVFAPASII